MKKITILIALLLPLVLFCQQNRSNNKSITCNKIYIDKKNSYYSQDNILLKKDSSNSKSVMSYSISAKGDKINYKNTWSNFIYHNDEIINLRFEQFCFTCDSLKTEKTQPSIYFHHRYVNQPRNKSEGKIKVYLDYMEAFGIPNKEFLSSDSTIFSYDFIIKNENIYLILMSNKKLHIYKAKDSNNLIQNKWKHIKTVSTKLKTEYFISYINDEDKLQLVFPKQGTLSIDASTYETSFDNTIPEKQYIIFDVLDNYSYRLVDKKTALQIINKSK